MFNTLLHTPEGVRDIYGEEYAKKLHVEEQLHRTISSFGFQDIQTPSFEYFDVFSKEVGTTPSKELYKFFDNENNTLVLRPDFTPSIARCAAKYFMEDKGSVRFTYKGSAFSKTSSLQGKLDEVTQMGAELIGDDSVEADAELIALAIEALKSTGLQNFRVSIGEMEYFKGLCEQAGLDTATENALRSFVSGKNYFAVQELLDEKGMSKDFRDTLQYIANSFEDASSLEVAKTKVKNQRSLDAIARLEKLYHVLEMYGLEEYVSFDLSILSKYNYYTGVIFRVYTYGVGQPIVKGGRYDNLLQHFGKDAPAIGFVIAVDDLLESLSRQKVSIETPEPPALVTYFAGDEKDFKEKLLIAKSMRAVGRSCVLKPVNK